MRIYVYAFCRKFGKMSQIRVSRGVHPDYYDITQGSLKFITILKRGGGLPDLLQYYKGEGGGGSLGTPNLYYVIYGRPLIFRMMSWKIVSCALSEFFKGLLTIAEALKWWIGPLCILDLFSMFFCCLGNAFFCFLCFLCCYVMDWSPLFFFGLVYFVFLCF